MNIKTKYEIGQKVTVMNGLIQGEVDGFYYSRAKVIHVDVKWIDDDGDVESRYFIEDEIKSAE